MDELKFEEHYEEQVILCTSPKRKTKIKIFVPLGGSSMWRVQYEDGHKIDHFESMSFTSRKLAIQAVRDWEKTISKTKEAKHSELFGDKKPPVLKRKTIRGARTKTINS